MSRICKVPEQKPKSKRLLICAMDTHESLSPELRRIGISCTTARSLILIILMHDVALIVMRTGVDERLGVEKKKGSGMKGTIGGRVGGESKNEPLRNEL